MARGQAQCRPFYHLTLKCDLDLQPTWTNIPNGTSTRQEQPCQIIYKIHAQTYVMARTSSLYDHFISWPSSVTVTFNLPDQMFKIALLNLKENNCAKILWNPCINIQAMTWTSSIYNRVMIWLSSVTLTVKVPEQMFQMALLQCTFQGQRLCHIILKSINEMHKCTSYGPDKSGRTHAHRTHTGTTHIYRTEFVTTVSLTASGLDKKGQIDIDQTAQVSDLFSNYTVCHSICMFWKHIDVLCCFTPTVNNYGHVGTVS